MSSQFNLILEIDEGKRYFLQNTLTGKGAFVPPVLATRILENPEHLEPSPELHRLGAITENRAFEKLRLAMEINRARYAATDALSLTILTTSSCNLSCHYCYQSVLKEAHAAESLTDEVESAIVSFVRSEISHGTKALSVTWYGGEPLLNSVSLFRLSGSLRSICDANNLEYSASLVTNATLIDETLVARLVQEAAVTSFQVTLEAGRARHDRVRSTRAGFPTYRRILSAASVVAENATLDLRINVDASSSLDDVDEVLADADVLRLLENNRVSAYLGRILYFPSLHIHPQSRQLTEAEYAALVSRFLPRLFGLPSCNNTDERIKLLFSTLAAKGPERQCGEVTPNSLVFDPIGRIFKCWEEVGQPSKAVGDLRHPLPHGDSNLAFWLGSDYWNNAECQHCPLLPVCKGGCPYFSLHGYPKASYRCDFIYPVVLSALVREYSRKLLGEEASLMRVANWPQYPDSIPL